MKLTGLEWAENLLINVIDPKGWADVKDFKSRKITKLEFLQRTANSVIDKSIKPSRRDAAKLLQRLKTE